MGENLRELIYVLTGPSASGKTTLLEAVIKGVYTNSSGEEEYLPENCRHYCQSIKKIVTATTRKPRYNEIEGIHYIFLNDEQFREEREKANIIEETFYSGSYYGTPRAEVDKIFKNGLTGIIALDRNGVKEMKRIYGDDRVISIFIYRELGEIIKELRARKITEEEFISRSRAAEEELKMVSSCDFVIKNTGTLEKAVEELCSIIMETIREKR